MKTYTTPLLLYTGLLLSVILNKYYNISFLTPLILLIPLLFVDLKNLNLISKWSLGLLCTVPFIFFQDLYSTLNQLSIAFSEELFFRVYLMSFFSNFTTSILFTIPHILLYGDLHSFLVFLPSLIYGFVYQKTKSFILIAVLHFLSNVFYDKILLNSDIINSGFRL
ncbi:caax amino protease family protein [Sulfurihydrogenibium azorense Az-Fu1]|uniref:Caax amino protease family protein n=1 Tax=Sulfurihydrogenibium azorense (strain DSM 15241 / OCM 825 / Az-Fu1) TaxID=204536 RepID=C1DTS5_SULAA|nr:CPBP family glutamic-type intramembrane protease [Sulfurihydrogenibium azorense]ACN98207.1 caax amino protease family protein [Sulfurihydrogenibium azorense Az-Fu1]